MVHEILDQPYVLSPEQVSFYRDNNYIKLKQVLSPDVIAHFNNIISKTVARISDQQVPLAQRDTYGKAFLQLFNLWTHDDEIKQLVLSKRLGKIAADLTQVEGVKLYHDQALYKEAGGGITPWHADQYYWPLSSDNTITAWIPLQETPLDLGPLEFSAGSHQIKEGRDLMISDQSEKIVDQNLRVTDYKHVIETFDIGEVSYHSGWIFHRAGANHSSETRKVMTIIYMDQSMRLKQPENEGQQNDWETWCPGTLVGEVINTALNPLIYERGK